MPKNPNVRKRKANGSFSDSVLSKDREIWLTNIKSLALSQLPGSASPRLRVQLRKNVEEEMRAFGLNSFPEEIHDVLQVILKECTSQTETLESPSTTPPPEDQRKPWLDRWKNKAVAQLPPTASAQERAALRRKVEQGLEEYGPHVAEREIEDIVATLVLEMTFQMETEAMDQQRISKKLEMINFAEYLLTLAVKKFPDSLVGKPDSWERHHLVEPLKVELRLHLEERLTGDESMEELSIIFKAFLGGWEKSAILQSSGSGGLTRRTIVAEVVGLIGVGATMFVPSIREKAQKGWHYLHTEGVWENILNSVAEHNAQKGSGAEPPSEGPSV
jgi:hypothetical protein